MRNPGYLCEIIEGVAFGKFATVIKSEQAVEFLTAGKLLVHIFEDQLCTQPVIDEITGKPKQLLKKNEMLKVIGMID